MNGSPDVFRPSPKVRLFLFVWRVAWLVLLPAVLGYLWIRGRKDPAYFSHPGERFGRHESGFDQSVWVHAVSLGELRSAEPIIRAFLARGENVVTTHFTPAGRAEASRLFGADIRAGQLRAVWVPFDYGLAFTRFFRAFKPKFGLVMEVEFWPGMIFAARRRNVPLFLCNGQYPIKSFERDQTKWLSPADFVAGFAGAMVKTEEQASRFRLLGLRNIRVTGEMRFDQPIPATQIAAADRFKRRLQMPRVIGLVNITEPEEEDMIAAVAKVLSDRHDTLFVLVPRAPERFGPLADRLRRTDFNWAARSEFFADDLSMTGPDFPPETNLLLGDSLGEMHFYLSLCDWVVVGGGFTPAGSHNIIEPLSQQKPVVVGPEIWTIEYPAKDAIAAGVCRQITTSELADMLRTGPDISSADISAFFETHGGTVEKTMGALRDWGVYSD